MNINR